MQQPVARSTRTDYVGLPEVDAWLLTRWTVRAAVARAYDRGDTSAEVAEVFGCSESWVRRLIRRRREAGSLAPREAGNPDDQRTYGDADERKIRDLIRARPDATLAEVVEAIGKAAHPSTACRTSARLDLPRKKKSTHAAERDRPDVKAARDDWPGRSAGVTVDQLVFADEFGANTSMQRTHGRAAPGRAGRRVRARAGHHKSISTIAALSADGIVASATFGGATDTDLFVAFVRERLVPGLRPGQVVVLDNLQAHESPRVEALVEAAGATVVRLPPYSPDPNPIEMAFSKVKTFLRKLARRAVKTLIAGIIAASKTIRVADVLGYFGKCGYATG